MGGGAVIERCCEKRKNLFFQGSDKLAVPKGNLVRNMIHFGHLGNKLFICQ